MARMTKLETPKIPVFSKILVIAAINAENFAAELWLIAEFRMLLFQYSDYVYINNQIGAAISSKAICIQY